MYFKTKLKGVKHSRLVAGINWIPKRQERKENQSFSHTPLINNVNWIEFPCRPYAEPQSDVGIPYKSPRSQIIYDFSVSKNGKLKND